MPPTLTADPEVTEFDSPTVAFEGVIGVEGLLTGDGRLIAENSLQWATFPLPLRYAAQDFGGHDGALIVGRIDRVERLANGDIYAWGVLDLGSKDGRECARLMRGQFLSGVSMDLDTVDAFEADVQELAADGTPIEGSEQSGVYVTQAARVRAATLVAIPAFDEARLSLIASTLAAKGPDAQIVVGSGTFNLIASTADVSEALRAGVKWASMDARKKQARREKLASDLRTFSPRARLAAELASDRAEFAGLSYLKQWRNPANGQWIDMPSIALGKLMDALNDNDAGLSDRGHDFLTNAEGLGEDADKAIAEGDLERAQSAVSQMDESIASALNELDNPNARDLPEVTEGIAALDAVLQADAFDTGDTAAIDEGDLEGASFDDPAPAAPKPVRQVSGSAQALDGDLSDVAGGDLIARQRRLLMQGGSGAEMDAIQAELDARGMSVNGSADPAKAAEAQAPVDDGAPAATGDLTPDASLWPEDGSAPARVQATDGTAGEVTAFSPSTGLYEVTGDDGSVDWYEASDLLEEKPISTIPDPAAASDLPDDTVPAVDFIRNELTVAEDNMTDDDIRAEMQDTAYSPDEIEAAIREFRGADGQDPIEVGDGNGDEGDDSETTSPASGALAPGTPLFNTDMESEAEYEVTADGSIKSVQPGFADMSYGPVIEDASVPAALEESGLDPAQFQDGEVFESVDATTGDPVIYAKSGDLWYSGALQPVSQGGVREGDGFDDLQEGDILEDGTTVPSAAGDPEKGGFTEPEEPTTGVLKALLDDDGTLSAVNTAIASGEAKWVQDEQGNAELVEEMTGTMLIGVDASGDIQYEPEFSKYMPGDWAGPGFGQDNGEEIAEPEDDSELESRSRNYDSPMLTQFEKDNVLPGSNVSWGDAAELVGAGWTDNGNYFTSANGEFELTGSNAFGDELVVTRANGGEEVGRFPDGATAESFVTDFGGDPAVVDAAFQPGGDGANALDQSPAFPAGAGSASVEDLSNEDLIAEGLTLLQSPTFTPDQQARLQEIMAERMKRGSEFDPETGMTSPEGLARATAAQPDVFKAQANSNRVILGGQPDQWVIEPIPTGGFMLRPERNGSRGDYGHFETLEQAQAAQAGATVGSEAWDLWGKGVADGSINDPGEGWEDTWQGVLEDLSTGTSPADAIAKLKGGGDSGGNGGSAFEPDPVTGPANPETGMTPIDDFAMEINTYDEQHDNPARSRDLQDVYNAYEGGDDEHAQELIASMESELQALEDAGIADDDDAAIKEYNDLDDAIRTAKFYTPGEFSSKTETFAAEDEDCGCDDLATQGVTSFAVVEKPIPETWHSRTTSAHEAMPSHALAALLTSLEGAEVPEGAITQATAYANELSLALDAEEWETVFRLAPDFYARTGSLYEAFLAATGTDGYKAAQTRYEILEASVAFAADDADRMYLADGFDSDVSEMMTPDGDGNAPGVPDGLEDTETDPRDQSPADVYNELKEALATSAERGITIAPDDLEAFDGLVQAVLPGAEESGRLNAIAALAPQLTVLAEAFENDEVLKPLIDRFTETIRAIEDATDSGGVYAPIERKVIRLSTPARTYSSARAEMQVQFANWVEEAGGLPKYIKRIAEHMQARGMTESHAIAAAVNTVKRWARGGDNVKPDTVAKALAAVAEWEAKKAIANATAAETTTFAAIPSGAGKALVDSLTHVASAVLTVANDVAEAVGEIEPGTRAASGHELGADVSILEDLAASLAATSRAAVGSLIASTGAKYAAPIAPPKAWFLDPKFAQATPITVSPEGHIYGHIATWDACHMDSGSMGQRCVRAPRSNNGYSGFHQGWVTTEEGEDVRTGRILAGAPHADPAWNLDTSLVHYSHNGYVGADVRAGEDRFGIWISGAIRPDISEVQLRALKASPLSGDWRADPRTGNLEMIAGLAVNSPGLPFPKPIAMVASTGAVTSMQAVGLVAPARVQAKAFSSEEIAFLKQRRAAAKAWSSEAARMAAARREEILSDVSEFAIERKMMELATSMKEIRNGL